MKKTIPVYNYSIKNEANNNVCDIHIDGSIVDASTQKFMQEYWGDDTSVSFKSFREKVENSGADTFNIYINSSGGHVGDALAMHDLIQSMKKKGKKCNTYGRGIVASSATYILMAGDEPEMSKNSFMMIHNVSGGVYGSVNEVENYAKTMRLFNDKAVQFYAEYTGISAKQIGELMNEETFMTAEIAKKKGFIKNVSDSVEFTEKISNEAWMFNDTAVLNAYNGSVKEPGSQDDNINTLLNRKFEDMKNFFKGIFNAAKDIKPAEGETTQDLVNRFVTALQPMENMDAEIEKIVNERVTAALSNEATTKIINDAVTAAVAGIQQKYDDLVLEVEQKIGGESIANEKEKKGEEPIGSWG